MNPNYKKRRTSGSGVLLEERAVTPKSVDNVRPFTRLSGSSATNGFQSARGDERPFTPIHGGVMKDNTTISSRTFVSPNITPRSGSRKTRAEAPSPKHSRPTPGGTPTTSRPQSSTEKRDKYAVDVKSPNAFVAWSPASGRTSRAESLLSDGNGSAYSQRPSVLERNNSSYSSNGITSPKGPSMFFHANDVQATVSSRPLSEQPTSQPSLQAWVNSVEGGSSERIPSMANNSLPDEPTSKFFYANDHNTSKSPPPRLSNAATSNRPPLQTIYSAAGPVSPQRAPSPLKDEITPPRRSSISQASPRRHTRLVSNGGSEIKAPDAIKTDLSRRSSLNSRAEPRTSTSHIRSPSVHSTGGSHSRRASLIQPANTSPTDLAKKRSSVNGFHGALPLNVKPPTSSFSFSQDHNGPPSPTTSQGPTVPQSKIEHMNELAAKARRERKVLDLEISNSSLLAINRTLEREMRKQNSELRHYRRLSRSGRLSVLSTSRSKRKSKLSDLDNGIDSDDGTSASGSEDDDNDGEEGLSTKSSASNVSSGSPTARAARARFQDPERPSLDLSAHRLLLLESQKINQAIKRCLSHSDAMISAGKQALEAQAHHPEPEPLGPRVLTPGEDDEAFERGQALLSPSLGPGSLTSNPWEQSLAPTEPFEDSHPQWEPSDLPAALPTHDPASSEDKSPGTPPRTSDVSSPPSSQPLLLTTLKPPSSPPQPHDPSSPSPLPHPTPPADDQDHSFVASLDGISPSASPSTPSSQTTSPSPAPHLTPTRKPHPASVSVSVEREEREDEESTRPPSPTRPPPTTNAAANVPGNRSSIQNLGTYFGFQNLGLFGQAGGGG